MIVGNFESNSVQLSMSRDDYSYLHLLLGIAAGSMHSDKNMAGFWGAIKFINQLNANNPNFVQYEVPKEKESNTQ